MTKIIFNFIPILLGITFINITPILNFLNQSFVVYNLPPIIFLSLGLFFYLNTKTYKEIFLAFSFVFFSYMIFLVNSEHLPFSIGLRQVLAASMSIIIIVTTYFFTLRHSFSVLRAVKLSAYFYVFLTLIVTIEFIIGYDFFSRLMVSVFSPQGSYAIINYIEQGRMLFLQAEPRMAAVAIFCSMGTFCVGLITVKKYVEFFLMFLLLILASYYTKSASSFIFLIYSIFFVSFMNSSSKICSWLLYATMIFLIAVVVFRDVIVGGDFELLVQQFLEKMPVQTTSFISVTTTISLLGLGAKAFVDAPIFGQGIGGFFEFVLFGTRLEHAFLNYELFSMIFGGESIIEPKNFFIRVLAEGGSFGFILFLLVIFKLKNKIKAFPNRDFHLLHYVFGLMILSLFGNASFFNPTFFLFAFLLGAAVKNNLNFGELKQKPNV